MSPQYKNINIIHNCEEHLYNWLKVRLVERGVSVEHTANLSEILEHHESELDTLKQHIKPLKKWNKIKDRCYSLSTSLNGSAEQDEELGNLIEKAAMEGQVLWLTIKEE